LRLTVELDSFSAARDVTEVGDGDLSAVGHLADERAAGDRTSAVLDVNLVISCNHSASVYNIRATYSNEYFISSSSSSSSSPSSS